MDIYKIYSKIPGGMLLGNLDPKFANTYKATTPICLPFLGCCFGASINIVSAVMAGVAGILLSVIFLVINVGVMLPVDKLINRRPGYAAVSMCSVAGIALTVPTLLMDGPYAEMAAAAVPQIALCLIITCIVSPFLTKGVVKLWGSAKNPKVKVKA